METVIELPACKCPVCKYDLNWWTKAVSPTGKTPQPGHVVVCSGCGEVLEFRKDMTLEQASVRAMMEIHPEARIAIGVLQQRIRSTRK